MHAVQNPVARPGKVDGRLEEVCHATIARPALLSLATTVVALALVIGLIRLL